MQHGTEPVEYAALCIRVIERFLGAVEDDPKLRRMRIEPDLWAIYADVLQEELAPFAYELAYRLFTENQIVREWRRDKDRQQ
jgi:hypothetical protein